MYFLKKEEEQQQRQQIITGPQRLIEWVKTALWRQRDDDLNISIILLDDHLLSLLKCGWRYDQVNLSTLPKFFSS